MERIELTYKSATKRFSRRIPILKMSVYFAGPKRGTDVDSDTMVENW